MNRTRLSLFVATSLLATSALVGLADAPAGALTATTSGTVVNVSISGTERATFTCVGGNVAVVNTQLLVTTVATPNLACGAVTQVQVTGDANGNFVDGRGLDAAAFSNNPKLVVFLGDGDDVVYETQAQDSLAMAGGSDTIHLQLGGATNGTIDMGSNPVSGRQDTVVIQGPNTDDTFDVSSPSASSITLTYAPPGGATSWTILNVEDIEVYAGGGNDFLSSGADACPSFCRSYVLDGQAGDDTVSGGTMPTTFYGGSGANTFNTGRNRDVVYSDSDGDAFTRRADGYGESVWDVTSPRFGGRTFAGFGTARADLNDRATYVTQTSDNDAVLRVRPNPLPGITTAATMSLDRTGQQSLPTGFGQMVVKTGPGPTTAGRKFIGDVVATPVQVGFGFSGGPAAGAIYDITVPTGSWTETVASGFRTIDPTDPALGNIIIPFASPFKVHGPWSNPNQGFAHRATRDLLFRFPTDAARDQVRDQLASGTRTRTQVVRGMVYSDEYRGLDVDRVFVRFLRRSPDAGGRTYWIGSIRNGKSLRQFRAQLFGSNEYFTKAGGTNAAFVERAFQDVLGRKPDPSGLAYWTNKANSGTERGLIARQFLSSTEARRFIVRDQFLRLLNRQPTTAEIDTWVATLGSSATGEQDLVVSLASSSAYFGQS